MKKARQLSALETCPTAVTLITISDLTLDASINSGGSILLSTKLVANTGLVVTNCADSTLV